MKIRPNSALRNFAVAVTIVWMGIFAVMPIGLMFITSLLTRDSSGTVGFTPTLANYLALLNPAYLGILLRSLSLAAATTLICLGIGYPFAYFIARSSVRYRSLLLLLVIIPFWTNSLIRVYAIMTILKAKGILNALLLALGWIHQPLPILYSHTAVLVGCVYDLLPFMILPLYSNLEKLNPAYLEAARDLGANWVTTFLKVIIPLTISGIISGCLLVFLPAMTMFYIPVLLGGSKNLLLGNLIEYQFLSANNWPLGAAIGIIVTLLMGGFIAIYWNNNGEKVANRES